MQATGKTPRSLRATLILALVVPMAILVGLATAMIVALTLTIQQEAFMTDAEELTQTTAVQISELLWELDLDLIETLLENLRASGVIEGAEVAGDLGDRLVIGTAAGTTSEIAVRLPLTRSDGGETLDIGQLTLHFSDRDIRRAAWVRAIAIVIIAGSAIILTAVVIFTTLDRRVLNPIVSIKSALRRVSPDDPSPGLPIDDSTRIHMTRELAEVVEAMEEMRGRILLGQRVATEQKSVISRAAQIAGLGYAELDLKTWKFTRCSDEFAAMLGMSKREAMELDTRNPEQLKFSVSGGHESWRERLRRQDFDGPFSQLFEVFNPDGSVRFLRAIMDPVQRADGDGFNLDIVSQDVTDIREAEDRLRQAEKMQTIGQLTGGVAHDFNNLLAIISGNLELLRETNDPAEVAALIENGLGAVDRGARLTAHLLAFARKQPLSPETFDPVELLDGLVPILRVSAGPGVDCETECQPGVWPILADRIQLEACLLNLVVNARDSMPLGGKLKIAVRNLSLDEAEARKFPEIDPGEFVCLSVSDTGHGMPPEIVEKAFEPFFTTKAAGKGTGLGLSMVYGFARQSKGSARIVSTQDQGTVVHVLLPRAETAQTQSQADLAPRKLKKLKDRHIMVIEDEFELCALYARQLRSFGCEVTAVNTGEEAIAFATQHANPPDIILTDIALTGAWNGMSVAQRLTGIFPKAEFVFMSGMPDADMLDAAPARGATVLKKPFSAEALASALEANLP